jgi:hypothetical protein
VSTCDRLDEDYIGYRNHPKMHCVMLSLICQFDVNHEEV